jgi:hypothetical protein
MSHLYDLPLLLVIAAIIGLWLKLSRARERACVQASRLCRQHGLQLLDETVGLRGLRLRKWQGQWQLERCYGFEVSIDGDDREPSKLWMVHDKLTGYNLPTIRTRGDGSDAQDPPAQSESGREGSNVVPLRPRLRDGSDRHH